MSYKYHLDNRYFSEPVIFRETKLWQIGRLYCNPSSMIHAHKQLDGMFELTVVTAGKGVVYTNGIPMSVGAGDIYISFPEEIHEIVSDGEEPLQFDFIAFSTENGDFFAQLKAIWENNKDAKKRIFQSDSICDKVRSGIWEIKRGGRYSDVMMADICEQIIITLIRIFEEGETGDEKNNATDADSLCYQAMSYIDSHLFSMKSLTEVSNCMNYNYSYLSNLFKKTMGQRLVDYYRIRRLETAKHLLAEKGRKITQIAEMLNYSSVYAFSRAFKAEYGYSPNQYKKNNA